MVCFFGAGYKTYVRARMGKTALVIILLLVLLWFFIGQPRIGFNASLGKAEHMIDEDAWLEMPRGFKVKVDGGR